MNKKIIFHLDMDAFFASVEVAHNPILAGRAVIIGGSPDKRGVVSTCSYEARKFGVRSAMPMSRAVRLCPHAVFLPGNYQMYKDVSLRVMNILQGFTKKVEVVSIDEAYLDVTDLIKHAELAIPLAKAIKESIFRETSLTCSIGIAPNKLIAKIISSRYKPNGLHEVLPGREKEFLAPLPVGAIPGIGKKTQMILAGNSIETIQHLQEMGMEDLITQYGSRGYHYFLTSLGRDNRSVEWEPRTPKSLSAETTFEKDSSELSFLKDILHDLTQRAWERMRKKKMLTKGVSVKIRDSAFNTISRSKIFSSHTSDFKTIGAAINTIFDSAYTKDLQLRLLGVTLEPLTDHYWQPTFWD